MNVKQTGLAGRVARFAALADPVRLTIVDLLTLSDVAPVELQSRLAISSSLLSHHLRQLEQAGLILRSRSEADRRRTYLHLVPRSLDDLLPATRLPVRRLVFVCTQNSARSRFAAALWHAASDVPVTSAGTHPADRIDPGAVGAAHRHGLALDEEKPRGVGDVLDPDDFVVTVCDSAHEELGDAGRLHWSVPDPARKGTDEAFDVAFEDVASRIQGLAPMLTSAHPGACSL